ncbi:MAG: tetratricopeptide repeat protein [Bacteroidota bacterium]
MTTRICTLLLLSLVLLTNCGTGTSVTLTDLTEGFSQLTDPETGLLNEEAATEYVNNAMAFAKQSGQDTVAALPLYRAAEVARALGKPAQAIEIYQSVIDQYSSFSKAAEAQFMLAFSYDEDLNDLEKARTAYETFIDKYPTHGFADDAEMLLSNLGKSDEEILRELEAKLAQPEEGEGSEE